jgi:hypothetical protein
VTRANNQKETSKSLLGYEAHLIHPRLMYPFAADNKGKGQVLIFPKA